MYSLGQDLRYGARLLWRAPGFAAVALVTLALGIGATTAIFSVVDAVLMKPLPFRDAARVIVLWEKRPSENLFKLKAPAANFIEWQRSSRSFEQMAGILDTALNLTGGPNGRVDAEELKVERVSATLFPMLGVQAIVGRTFLPEEDQPGHGNFALLSHSLWQRKFGSDKAIGGKSIRLRTQVYTVVGVLPAGFALVEPGVDVYLPLAFNAADARMGAARVLTVLGRLRDGVTLEQAKTEMASIGNRLEAGNPALNRGWSPSLFPIEDELFGQVQRALWVLLGAVGFLLLMACVNVANLLLARGARRQKEIAIRSAVGAGRGRLISQFISESLLLSLAGGALGLLLARLGIWLTVRFGPSTIPRLADARLNGQLLLFALAVTLLTGLLFGIAPAVHGSRGVVQAALRDSGRSGTAGRSTRGVRSSLVVVEIALAVLISIGAGLLLRSFQRLRAIDLGFQPEHALTFRLPMGGGRNNAPERRIGFLDDLLKRVGSLPGALGAGAATWLPLTGFGNGTGFALESEKHGPSSERPIALLRGATTGYFRALGTALVDGRNFTETDTATSAPVVIVDRTLARQVRPDGKVVGQRLWMDANERAAEIVGVVGSMKPVQLEDRDWATIYIPYPQKPDNAMMAVVRTVGDPASLASAVERTVHRIEPEQPVAGVRPMDAVVEEAISGARFNAVALGFFGSVAFLLSALGIYGVMSYDVAGRTNEIGIRVALGASRPQVFRMILGQGARLAAIGIILGLAGALVLTRSMASMLYGVDARDFYTFAGIAGLLGAVAIGASYLPARRAMRVEPVAALRHE